MLGAIKKRKEEIAWVVPHCVNIRERVSVRVKREGRIRKRERKRKRERERERKRSSNDTVAT